MDLTTNRVQEQLGAALMGMAMNLAKEQSATLAKLMDGSALATLRDPALGSNLDLLA